MSNNHFHCTEDEEHVMKTSWEDVNNILHACEYFNWKFPANYLEEAKQIVKNKADNETAHGFLHLLTENDIELIEQGRLKEIVVLRAIYEYDPSNLYNSYCNAIRETNNCGTKKRTPFKFEAFKELV